MDAMPALEIYADDVKCTHGSTTGPLDEDMLFYLRSRGVSMEAAKHLLSYAFAADITRRIRVAPVRVRLEDFMAAQHGLPLDLRITDLGQHDEAACPYAITSDVETRKGSVHVPHRLWKLDAFLGQPALKRMNQQGTH